MAAFQGTDRLNAVVADIGSFATKIGWAGNDYPKSYFRSVSANVLRVAALDRCDGSLVIVARQQLLVRLL